MADPVTTLEAEVFVDGFLDAAQSRDGYRGLEADLEREMRESALYKDRVRHVDYGAIQDAYASGALWYGEYSDEISLEQGGGSLPMHETVKRIVLKYLTRSLLQWAQDVEREYPRFAGAPKGAGALGFGRTYAEYE